MTSIHSKALGFLKVLVQENAITFQQDRKHNDWTFGYYLNNAYFRLQLAYKKLPSIDQRGDSNLRAVVDEVVHAINVDTLEPDTSANELGLNEIGVVKLRLSTPLIADDYRRNRTTGSFVLIDEASNATVGAGMVSAAARY